MLSLEISYLGKGIKLSRPIPNQIQIPDCSVAEHIKEKKEGKRDGTVSSDDSNTQKAVSRLSSLVFILPNTRPYFQR